MRRGESFHYVAVILGQMDVQISRVLPLHTCFEYRLTVDGGKVSLPSICRSHWSVNMVWQLQWCVGVWTAEAWTAEDDASSDVDVPCLDYKKD